nr:Gfo/Idh/MocA family oxidoreductase [Allomuricauda sp.]
MKPNIRWGIIGPGNIAGKFSADLNLVAGAEIMAVASRNLEKARQFAKTFGATTAFGSYEELFASGTVDIVYIATPHNFHKDLCVAAMNHGLHVLCEKPAGINKREVEEILAVASKNQVFFMEGLWSRFNPTIKEVKKMVNEGAIGELSYVHADFAFYGLDREESSRVLNLDLAAGSLLDIGIYPIFLAYLLLGMPNDIEAFSNFHSNGTEIQTSMMFQYANAQAVLYSGITSNSKMEAEITGSKGALFIHPRWHEASAFSIEKEGNTDMVKLPLRGNGFVYEIEHVQQCLQEQRLESPLWSHQNSLDLVTLMDTIRQKTGIRFPFED